MTALGPEALARIQIDAQLTASGWVVQDRSEANVYAAPGVAIREVPLEKGHGRADYLLFLDGKAVGAFEAKKAGTTLTGIEIQADKYSEGLPSTFKAPLRPLPFVYIGTGEATAFFNQLDPVPRTREIFAIHRPETLAEWLNAHSLKRWLDPLLAAFTGAEQVATNPDDDPRWDDSQPSTLRSRLRFSLPPIEEPGLWSNQIEAIGNLERSLMADRPRALVQMVMGSGKSKFAVAQVYRLIKFAGARRVLFLVDRDNLAKQAHDEFDGFRPGDDSRKFTDLYNVQRLTSNTIASSSKVVISTIQRLYSILKGDEELPEGAEEGSEILLPGLSKNEPAPVVYNPGLPPEYFDVVVIDECHRSIYTLWRQVLEYFDAYLIGLTATPAAHTLGFFKQNLVMQYSHERAVADKVNVDHEVYRIRTRITESGSTIEASPQPTLGVRDRRTHRVRWEAPDEDITYAGGDLDRRVVAPDQIREIVKAFRDRALPELFPDRREVPKTLVFAKDDLHADDIVRIVREEFDKGNDFCQKITYKTTGKKPADLIAEFRTGFAMRIAVTVDMVATGTDIRPVEIVMFLRAVHSRVLFEQMLGRGVRVIDPTELRSVTPSAQAKTHFVVIDCVGVTESELVDTRPLEQQRGVSLKQLLDHVALGGTDAGLLSSLASRLARLAQQCDEKDQAAVVGASGGPGLPAICGAILTGLDADTQDSQARARFGLGPQEAPSEAQLRTVEEDLLQAAVRPLATRPALRQLVIDLKRKYEQLIDEVSRDEVLFSGASDAARERARALTRSFEEFLAENRAEIDALEFFYSQPYRKRLRYRDIKALAEAIEAPPRSWTPQALWRAYELLEKDKVRGAGSARLLTDVVSLVRFALHQDDELVPHAERVRQRFTNWIAGQRFTAEQVSWLEMMRDHVAASLEIEFDDFDLTPFAEAGGLGRAEQVFGKELKKVVQELNEVLAA